MTKAERLKKEAEEYRKYLKRVSELAEEEYNKSSQQMVNAAENMSRNMISAETRTQQMLKKLRQQGAADYEALREKEFNDIKVAHANGEMSDEQYYSRLAVLRDAYFQEGTNEWARYTLQIAKYNQSVISEQEKEIKEMTSRISGEFEKNIEAIDKKQQSLSSKLEDISSIYTKVSTGNAKNGGYSWIQLSDIDSELAALKEYNKNIIAARDRINSIVDTFDVDEDKRSKIKSGFLGELLEMDINDATGFSRYLNNVSKESLGGYLLKWSEKSELEELIPKNIYSTQTDEMLKDCAEQMSQSFTQSLEEKFGEVPDSFFTSGGDAAAKFRDGFIEAIDSALSDMANEINQKLVNIMPKVSLGGGASSVSNYSSYNIYGAQSPEQTALQIYKQEAKKRMLVGE